jgi:hypothetical protein
LSCVQLFPQPNCRYCSRYDWNNGSHGPHQQQIVKLESEKQKKIAGSVHRTGKKASRGALRLDFLEQF